MELAIDNETQQIVITLVNGAELRFESLDSLDEFVDSLVECRNNLANQLSGDERMMDE